MQRWFSWLQRSTERLHLLPITVRHTLTDLIYLFRASRKSYKFHMFFQHILEKVNSSTTIKRSKRLNNNHTILLHEMTSYWPNRSVPTWNNLDVSYFSVKCKKMLKSLKNCTREKHKLVLQGS